MFERLGLNVGRQPDNGAVPRPDNRAGWLAGDTPAPPAEGDGGADRDGLDVRVWDPSTQLRYARKRRPPAPAPAALAQDDGGASRG